MVVVVVRLCCVGSGGHNTGCIPFEKFGGFFVGIASTLCHFLVLNQGAVVDSVVVVVVVVVGGGVGVVVVVVVVVEVVVEVVLISHFIPVETHLSASFTKNSRFSKYK